MPKQRMAGYVPLKGAPAETEPAPPPGTYTKKTPPTKRIRGRSGGGPGD